MPRRIARFGLTLIELLVVLAVMAVLVSLLVPAVQAARRRAADLRCLNKAKQIGLTVALYESTFGLLPHVEATYIKPNPWTPALYALMRMTDDAALIPEFGGVCLEVPAYQCELEPSLEQWQLLGLRQTSNYVLNAQVFHGTASTQYSIPDGLSNTIATAERYSRCGRVTIDVTATWAHGSHRTTFADGKTLPFPHFSDIVPVPSGDGFRSYNFMKRLACR